MTSGPFGTHSNRTRDYYKGNKAFVKRLIEILCALQKKTRSLETFNEEPMREYNDRMTVSTNHRSETIKNMATDFSELRIYISRLILQSYIRDIAEKH